MGAGVFRGAEAGPIWQISLWGIINSLTLPSIGTRASSSCIQVNGEFVGLLTADRFVLEFPTLGWHLSWIIHHSEGRSLALQDSRHPWSCPLDASSNLSDYCSTFKKKRPEGSCCRTWLRAIEPDTVLVEGRDHGLVSTSLESGTVPGME